MERTLVTLAGLGTRLRHMLGTYEAMSGGRRWCVVFATCTLLYVATANYGPAFFIDSVAAAQPAWHVAKHGHLYIDDGSTRLPFYVPGVGGHLFSSRAPGIIGAAVPLYLVFPSVPPGTPSGVPAALTAVLFSAAAIATLTRVLETLIGRTRALAGGLLAAFGTSMWSVAASELFPHGIDALWLSSALWSLTKRRFWIAGIFLGIGIVTRPHIAVVALILGLGAGLAAKRLGPVVGIGLPSLTALATLVAYNKLVFGALNIRGGYTEYVNAPLRGELLASRWDYVLNILGTLVSGPRGLLVLSPFLLMLIPGIWKSWPHAPGWVRSAAIAGLAYQVGQWQTQSFKDGFLGGWLFYSYRYPLEFLILCSPLLAMSYQAWIAGRPIRTWWFESLAFLSVWIHGIGACVYVLDRDMPLDEWFGWSPAVALIAAPPAAAVLGVLGLVPAVCLSLWRLRHLRQRAGLTAGMENDDA
jgi:hypothetical protein